MSKMKITFRRRIQIQNWDLLLTVQRFIEHPVWLAILKLAAENAGRTSANMVHEILLLQRIPIVQARLLLNRVVQLGLLNDEFRLTPKGREALEHERIPTELLGLYRTAFVDDELIPQVVLSLEGPHEPRVDGNSLSQDGPAMREIQNASTVPDIIENSINKQIVNTDSTLVVIKSIETYGRKSTPQSSEIFLYFTLDGQATLRIGTPLNRSLSIPENLKFSYNEILDVLLRGFGRDWKSKEEVMLVSFKDTNESERRSFSKSFNIPNPEIPGFGKFESVSTPSLRIEPRTQDDAQEWFNWLLIDQLPSIYLQSSEFDQHVLRIREKIPTHFNIVAPSQQVLAKDLFDCGDSFKAWLLQAPLDLAIGDDK